jgi:hypothetical protein
VEKNNRMSREEIHDFGVQIVCDEMEKGGYEILGANPSLSVTPQIVAKKNGRLCFVVVRTDVYPNKGILADEREVRRNLEHAKRNDAVCYFAGVGICNAAAKDAGDEQAKGIPVKGGGFYVDFDGLKVITSIDRVNIANGNERPGKGIEDSDKLGGRSS